MRKSAGYFENVQDFLKKTNIQSKVLNKFGEKNYGKHGSSLELQVRHMLDILKVPYKEQVQLSNNQRVDFLVKGTYIEVNGDYWHGLLNQDFSVKNHIERDKKKLMYFKNYNLPYIIIWEHELKENPEKVFDILKSL